jgi:RNA-directed DNA polymerase
MQIILENLYKAYFEARKNKRNRIEQLKFEVNYERYLQELYEQILTRSYKVQPCKAFVIEKPVYREVFAPQFIDRVIHHCIALYINPQVEQVLIEDCYSCRKGKGTLYGIERTKQKMRSITQNYAKDAFILKLDISGYFMNMNTAILHDQIQKLQLVENVICSDYEKEVLHYLIAEVIFTNPIYRCQINCDTALWKFIPKTKSLFHSPEGSGLPIGNLTSQIFGNIYLNDFDHWVKDELGIRFYGRYVDDMYFMHNDAVFLKQCIAKIQDKMKTLGMQVHPKKIYFQHYTKGIHFLGRYIKPYRSYCSNRIKNNFLMMIAQLEKDILKGEAYFLENGLMYYYRSCINSYFGFFIKANSYSFIKIVITKLSDAFYNYFYFEKKLKSWKCKITKKYKLYGTLFQPAGI